MAAQLVQLIGKYRQIVNALYALPGGRGAIEEIASVTGLKPKGISRMLATLAEHGVVELLDDDGNTEVWRLRPDSPHAPGYVPPQPAELLHARL